MWKGPLENVTNEFILVSPSVSRMSCLSDLDGFRDGVTYWPSTEPSIKRCTCVNKQRNSGNRCIRSKISEYHLDSWTWLNSVQMRTPTGSRWMSNNYISRCRRRLESVGVRVAVPVGDKIPEWEPGPDRGLGSSGPTVEQPSRMRKKCCCGQRNLGSICGSLSPSPTHLSHITNINPFATLSRIKCEVYIFIKKRVRSFLWISSVCWRCFRVYLYKETIAAITIFYRNTKVKVRSPDGDTEYFDIVAGVLQGDTLAPYLFIICLDYVFRTSIDKIRANGFKLTKKRSRRYPATTITDADYADDIAILANTPDQAETLLSSLERAAAGIGLYVNAHKTEYMCYNQTGDISTLNTTPLKLVDRFTYLGSSVESTEKDIDTRLTKAWTAINYMEIRPDR